MKTTLLFSSIQTTTLLFSSIQTFPLTPRLQAADPGGVLRHSVPAASGGYSKHFGRLCHYGIPVIGKELDTLLNNFVVFKYTNFPPGCKQPTPAGYCGTPCRPPLAATPSTLDGFAITAFRL